MDLGISGHVAIVTGAGRGIGAGIARALGREGAHVIAWDRDAVAADAMAQSIRAEGGTADPVHADVTRKAEVADTVALIHERFGPTRILVNNAGFSVDASLVEMTEEQWDQALGTNLKGVFLVTQAVAPTMIAKGYGRIVMIASRSHLGGEPNKSNYSAAKGGVVSFTRALACELGPHSVTVNAIAPGFTLTDRLMALPHFQEIEARSRAKRLIPRAGTPEDIAQAVLYAASVGAGYLTGEVIHVSGGRFS
jgi:3-oxoacyl-[acyl-carrier protein] reductase